MNPDIFLELEQAIKQGRKVALATVVTTKGHTPQRPGARMLIYKDGDLSGTVGGGCVEAEVVAAAQRLLREGKAALCRFELIASEDEPEADVCGGVMEIFIQPYGR
ncbi:MAG: XdhC family protein [Acidobacteriota bacterium]|nr:XdhC family protein [Blastocatellia bacterium]MDW8411081.1 XdhC family protein [Acidobacteriota bacterium]